MTDTMDAAGILSRGTTRKLFAIGAIKDNKFMPDITQYVQLGGQVVVVVLFLQYLTKRDKENIKVIDKGWEAQEKNASASIQLAVALQKLTDKIELNSNTSDRNTASVGKNITAIDHNTDALKDGNGK